MDVESWVQVKRWPLAAALRTTNVIGAVQRAAQTLSDPADLISVSFEAPAKERIELPAHSTLDRLVSSL